MIRLRAGAATDVGQVRQVNQDNVLVTEHLFVVADGMGGHRGGEIASEVAVTTLAQSYTDRSPEGLAEAVQQANSAVVAYAEDDQSVRGMGTTVCALTVVEADGDDHVVIVNVGDSRCYLAKREGGLEQITEDHSLVATLQRQGQLTAEEAAVHPHRNILTRALGIDDHVLVDQFVLRAIAGDRYLICSDGLFNEVAEDEIDEVLRRVDDPTTAAEELVAKANAGGGRDNISVVIVDTLPDDAHPIDARVDGRLEKVVHAEEPLAEEIRQAGPAVAAASGRAAGPVDAPAAAAPDAQPQDADPAALAVGQAPPTRFTWRVAVFLVLVVGVVALGVGILAFYARSSFTVALQGDELVVLTGRDVLFFRQELDERCDITVDQIKVEQVRRLEAGVERGSAEEARQLIRNSVEDPKEVAASPCLLADGESPPSTTTSTSAPTTTVTSTTTTAPTTLPPTTVAPTTAVPVDPTAPTTAGG